MRELYSYSGNACLPFFILPDLYSPNGNSHLDHDASKDACFIKEVPFRCVQHCNKILGVIFAPKIEKNSSLLQKYEILE
jgi:hypothetical protein